MSAQRAVGTAIVVGLMAFGSLDLNAQSVSSHILRVPDVPRIQFDLVERLRIGSLDGEHDAFSRVVDVAMDEQGRLFVADDGQHSVLVFDSAGKYLTTVGRQGAGPGEFQAPWRIELGPADSIFIWDSQLARISVFSPSLKFVRSFAVSPAWLINSIKFRPDGSLLVAAYGAGDGLSLRALNRDGSESAAFGPMAAAEGLAGFEASLLGGTIDVTPHSIIFSSKSPYQIWIFSLDGRPLQRCVGSPEWTTSPSDVVTTNDRGQSLNWNRYVHSSRILALSDSMFINVVLDPVEDRRILDIVTSDCELLQRTQLEGPTNLIRYRNGRFLAARTLDFPEVLVYESRQRH